MEKLVLNLKSKRLGQIVLLMGLTLSAGTVVFSQPEKASASVVEATSKDKVPADHIFIAHVTKDSKFTAHGKTGTKKVKPTSGDYKGREFLQINPYDAKQAGSYVEVSNVGVQDGKSLDLRVTVDKFTPYVKKNAYINVPLSTSLNYWSKGVASQTVSYSFYDHQTHKPVKVKGFMTINDIDNYQKGTIDKKGFQDKFYVAKDSRLKTADDGKTASGTAQSKTNYAGDDPKDMLTGIFTGDKVTVTYSKDFEADGLKTSYMEKDNDHGLKMENADMYGFSGKAVLNQDTPTPVKTVSDSDENDVSSDTLAGRTEKFTYSIQQVVPDQDGNKSFVMADKSLDPWAQYTGKYHVYQDVMSAKFNIKDVAKYKDVTKNFDVAYKNYDGQDKSSTITATAKSDFVKGKDFAGHNYYLVPEAEVKAGADMSKVKKDDSGNWLVHNVGEVTLNGDTKKTNSTDTKVRPIKPEVLKKVEDKDGKFADSVTNANIVEGKQVAFDIFNQFDNSGSTVQLSDEDQLPKDAQVDVSQIKVMMATDSTVSKDKNLGHNDDISNDAKEVVNADSDANSDANSASSDTESKNSSASSDTESKTSSALSDTESKTSSASSDTESKTSSAASSDTESKTSSASSDVNSDSKSKTDTKSISGDKTEVEDVDSVATDDLTGLTYDKDVTADMDISYQGGKLVIKPKAGKEAEFMGRQIKTRLMASLDVSKLNELETKGTSSVWNNEVTNGSEKSNDVSYHADTPTKPESKPVVKKAQAPVEKTAVIKKMAQTGHKQSLWDKLVSWFE